MTTSADGRDDDVNEVDHFCAQCYGRGVVRIDGRMLVCTCVPWPRTLRSNHDGHDAP